MKDSWQVDVDVNRRRFENIGDTTMRLVLEFNDLPADGAGVSEKRMANGRIIPARRLGTQHDLALPASVRFAPSQRTMAQCRRDYGGLHSIVTLNNFSDMRHDRYAAEISELTVVFCLSQTRRYIRTCLNEDNAPAG